MKKFILLFCCFFMAVTSHAQLLPAGELGGKIISGALYRKAVQSMGEAFFKPIIPTATQALRVEAFHASDFLNQKIDMAYMSAIAQTNVIISDLGRRIWYDLHDEMRAMPPLEIKDYFAQITKAKAAVHQAELFLKPGDAPLAQAKMALNRATQYYNMRATGVMLPLEEPSVDLYKQTEQAFKRDIFFLDDPVLPERKSSWRNFLSRPLKLETLPLPKNLRVAVVADLGVLDSVQTMVAQENLTGWKIDAYKTPEIFLSGTNHLSYDLVLTDILISGGGGIYLTRQLRDQQFTGSVLAVTAYPGEKEIGVKLQMAGMNGMITITDWDPYFLMHRPEFLAQKLRNYFYYHRSTFSTGSSEGNNESTEE